jgi:hypothetical protein
MVAHTMASKPTRSRVAKPQLPLYQLRLYIAGKTGRSIAATANLKRICELHLGGRYAIEVIDLLEQPQLAMADQILASSRLKTGNCANRKAKSPTRIRK